MEIFIHNLDPRITDNDLSSSIASLLALDSVQIFHVRKTRKKGCAVLTIADLSQGTRILNRYNRDPNASCFRLMNKGVCLGISRHSPDQHLLRSLDEENARHLRQQSNQEHKEPSLVTPSVPKNLAFQKLYCGRWEFHKSNLHYVAFGSHKARGTIRVDQWSLNLALPGSNNSRTTYDVSMDFNDVKSIAMDPIASQTTVTITLGIAPKIYGRESEPAQDLNSALRALFLDDRFSEPQKYRSRELGSLS
jgi:hypothetical protein